MRRLRTCSNMCNMSVVVIGRRAIPLRHRRFSLGSRVQAGGFVAGLPGWDVTSRAGCRLGGGTAFGSLVRPSARHSVLGYAGHPLELRQIKALRLQTRPPLTGRRAAAQRLRTVAIM